jgi:hypothetical protein
VAKQVRELQREAVVESILTTFSSSGEIVMDSSWLVDKWWSGRWQKQVRLRSCRRIEFSTFDRGNLETIDGPHLFLNLDKVVGGLEGGVVWGFAFG